MEILLCNVRINSSMEDTFLPALFTSSVCTCYRERQLVFSDAGSKTQPALKALSRVSFPLHLPHKACALWFRKSGQIQAPVSGQMKSQIH